MPSAQPCGDGGAGEWLAVLAAPPFPESPAWRAGNQSELCQPPKKSTVKSLTAPSGGVAAETKTTLIRASALCKRQLCGPRKRPW